MLNVNYFVTANFCFSYVNFVLYKST